MGRMTDEMTSLAHEIGALRDSRTAFMGAVADRVSNLREGARQMRQEFRTARTRMARAMRSESRAFLSGLQRTVSDIEKRAQGVRLAFAADLADARAAWSGRQLRSRPEARKAERLRKRRARE